MESKLLAFEIEEYKTRVERVRARMGKKKIDLMLINTPENIFYLTGHHSPGYYMYIFYCYRFVLGLLFFFFRIGLAETYLGLTISHLVISVPLAFKTLAASINSLDKRLEWSGQILGANNSQILCKIIFPQIKTGLIASFVFTFILSFNNVTMALFLTSVGYRTLPIEMFNRMYIGGVTPTISAISFMLAIFGVVIFIITDRVVGIFKYMGGGEA